jgi:hypothetical protein
MKACLVAVLSLLVVSSALAQRAYTEKQVIAYAKAIDVKMLDPSLSSQRLEDWLRSGPPRAPKVTWLVEDTCWNRPFKDQDYPLCAKIEVSRNDQRVRFLVQIGTWHKGIVGPPKLADFGIAIIDDEGPGVNQTGYAERLSDLPGLLDQRQATIVDGVRKLYEEIVAHHPMGIPTGAEKATIWPLLSKRLTGQLQTAQGCEEDYFRQHQTTDSAAKPSWMKTGIFSGDGTRALPTFSFACSKGPQKDGSFLVDVELAYTPDPMSSLHQMWGAEARVVAEDGRFVVDDVRIFDNDSIDGRSSTEGPSHLLSESFVGCDGSRWTGVAATNE